MKIKSCVYCGKLHKNKRFCSIGCRNKWYSENKKGEDNHNYKERIKKRCLFCNKEFEVLPSRNKRKFCCTTCFSNYNKTERVGKKNPMWGKTHKKESIEKWRESRKNGKGFACKDETKKLMSIKAKVFVKELWKNPEYKERQLMLQRIGQELKPNIPEIKLIKIIKENKFPFKYVGDGKFWIPSQPISFNPDFINVQEKLIIELFGDYWHNLDKSKIRDKKRLEAYTKFGYKTLIIWEYELKEIIGVINKIKEFIIEDAH
jgi:hypothetical protein